jgi:hypothetical protein
MESILDNVVTKGPIREEVIRGRDMGEDGEHKEVLTNVS